MSTDNPDLDAIAGDEAVTVRKAALAALFDLAVNSLDFGSGFWDTADTLAAREIAEGLGVCPTLATPSDQRRNYPICEGLRRELEAWLAEGRDEDYALRYASHKEHDTAGAPEGEQG